jgi:hypothetical protein
MKTMMEDKAMKFAIASHEGQYRKGGYVPMVSHPIRVADTLKRFGFSVETVIAGFLHDVVEDTDVTLDDIEKEFGAEVRRIVAGNTEDKTKTWLERKQHTIDWIREAPLEVRALIVADKLDNLMCLIQDHGDIGEGIWDSFHSGRPEQAWYFTSVADGMYTQSADIHHDEFPAYFDEYKLLTNAFFRPMKSEDIS